MNKNVKGLYDMRDALNAAFRAQNVSARADVYCGLGRYGAEIAYAIEGRERVVYALCVYGTDLRETEPEMIAHIDAIIGSVS